mgnify:CR=1 FL=1
MEIRNFDLGYLYFSNFDFLICEFLVKNPSVEFDSISNIFQISNELKFKFNPEKGFFCLDQPVRQCLEDSKGRTWTKNSTRKIEEDYEKHFTVLRKYFETEMNLFYKFLTDNYKSSIFDNGRFKWVFSYINKENYFYILRFITCKLQLGT